MFARYLLIKLLKFSKMDKFQVINFDDPNEKFT